MKTMNLAITTILMTAVWATPGAATTAFTGGQSSTGSVASSRIPNPMIDYPGFQRGVDDVGKVREERRITEAEFLEMASDPDTIIFDARSDAKFELLHVKGAKHLSLPDVTAAELGKIIPAKQTRILIYCNNNFANEPTALPGKAPPASLNLYTFNTLYSYGYKNVYELGPLIDIRTTKIPFEGTLVDGK